MDYDSSPWVGAVILCLLFILNFMLTAAKAAMQHAGETELEELYLSEERDPGQILDLMNHSFRLDHAMWLFRILACISAGAEMAVLRQRCPVWISCPVLIILLYLFGSSVPDMLG